MRNALRACDGAAKHSARHIVIGRKFEPFKRRPQILNLESPGALTASHETRPLDRSKLPVSKSESRENLDVRNS
jgi:hypothetical protein